MSEGLTDSELELLRSLLQRFAEHELDQFEHLRFGTSYGPVVRLLDPKAAARVASRSVHARA